MTKRVRWLSALAISGVLSAGAPLPVQAQSVPEAAS